MHTKNAPEKLLSSRYNICSDVNEFNSDGKLPTCYQVAILNLITAPVQRYHSIMPTTGTFTECLPVKQLSFKPKTSIFGKRPNSGGRGPIIEQFHTNLFESHHGHHDFCAQCNWYRNPCNRRTRELVAKEPKVTKFRKSTQFSRYFACWSIKNTQVLTSKFD